MNLKISKKERFWELCSNLTLKADKVKFPNKIFYFKDDKCMFDYNIKTGGLWYSYENIWGVFEEEYSLTYDEIQVLIKDEVEEHFKCKEVTPLNDINVPFWLVDEHFKCKVVTPYSP